MTKNTAARALRRPRQDNVVTRLAFGDYRIEDKAYAERIRRHTAQDHHGGRAVKRARK